MHTFQDFVSSKAAVPRVKNDLCGGSEIAVLLWTWSCLLPPASLYAGLQQGLTQRGIRQAEIMSESDEISLVS